MWRPADAVSVSRSSKKNMVYVVRCTFTATATAILEFIRSYTVFFKWIVHTHTYSHLVFEGKCGSPLHRQTHTHETKELARDNYCYVLVLTYSSMKNILGDEKVKDKISEDDKAKATSATIEDALNNNKLKQVKWLEAREQPARRQPRRRSSTTRTNKRISNKN